VLLSGGLDSAVLVADLVQSGPVLPVYVRTGLAWESAELAALDHLFHTSPFTEGVEPLTTVELGMRDVYSPAHWAITGHPPAYDTPDEDVYLAGRNLILLAKAGVVAAGRRLTRIALGPLAGNPFPDATPDFFHAMGQALSLGLNHPVAVLTPFATLSKVDVIRRGVDLGVALEWTMSCMNPGLANGRRAGAQVRQGNPGQPPVHCGLCSKCRERRDAFAAAGVDDPTAYANPAPRG